MNTEENIDVQISDDLDAFSAELFGQSSVTPTAATEDAREDEASDDAPELNTEGDTHDSDESDDDNDEGGSEEGESSNEPDPKPKKNRFQERIDELTNARREAERREQALREEFEAFKSEFKTNKNPEPTKVEADEGPKPDDLLEDGTEKYPNGEFDPQYHADRVKFLFRKEKEADEALRAQEAEQRQAAEAQLQLQTEWNSKLEPARERYPDFQDKAETLVNSFSDLNPVYGEYLSSTIMSMEFGPDVLYYLANNPDEARKIVNSGAAKATVALGRLESKFAFAEEQKQIARPKVSNAPTPPVVNKGSAPVKTTVMGDEDDLDLISAALFKRR